MRQAPGFRASARPPRFGNVGHDCCTVIVPKSKGRKHLLSAAAQAAAAEEECDETGSPPAGYVAVGDGPDTGHGRGGKGKGKGKGKKK